MTYAYPVPAACWDFGFESHRWHGCMSVVSVLCCQVEVSATSWSLDQRSPTDCGASLCVWSRNIKNEEALAHWGLLRQKKKLLAHNFLPYIRNLTYLTHITNGTNSRMYWRLGNSVNSISMLPTTTTNFISPVRSKLHIFRSFWSYSGSKYIIFKTPSKIQIYVFYFESMHTILMFKYNVFNAWR